MTYAVVHFKVLCQSKKTTIVLFYLDRKKGEVKPRNFYYVYMSISNYEIKQFSFKKNPRNSLLLRDKNMYFNILVFCLEFCILFLFIESFKEWRSWAAKNKTKSQRGLLYYNFLYEFLTNIFNTSGTKHCFKCEISDIYRTVPFYNDVYVYNCFEDFLNMC